MTLPSLGRYTAPGNGLPDLPERVLQFGTGAFLRGFAEFFIDQANKAGKLGGRVVMVGSTGSGRADRLEAQDGLYTLCVRGWHDGHVVDETTVIHAVSRAIASGDDWDVVLACARNPDLTLIISNTTEVGIAFDPDDRIDLGPPRSFPGKLTAVLFERARAFDFDVEKGVIVLPCELIDDNGEALFEIVQKLARQWDLGDRFLRWMGDACHFCNTVVDRIVPGTPGDAEEIYRRLGYRDALLTIAEPYRLWAIEGDAALAERLPLADVDPGIVVAGDIAPYRERKVRILNGTHTLLAPVALLCGCETVSETVKHANLSPFIRRLMFNEIVPSLDSDPVTAQTFASDVLDRFANPFIHHALRGITFQQTKKLRVRVVPSLLRFTEKTGTLPPSLVFGLASFLLFQHPAFRPGNLPNDDGTAYWQMQWASVDLAVADAVQRFVEGVALDESLWAVRLDRLPGFVETVTTHLVRAGREGVLAALDAHLQTVKSDADRPST